MSLDIRVRTSGKMQGSTAELSLEDDGYYWFLHPWLERLREQSGKYLDLYGEAVFTADDLPRLRRILDEVLADAARRPAQWEVCVGVQSHPVARTVYKTVDRARLLALLAAFRRVVDEAERCGGAIECSGD